MKTKNIEELVKSFGYLNEIVPVIDKIGSGFLDDERIAIALLLFFKEKSVLDALAFVRHTISMELTNRLTEDEYDALIEQEVNKWRPPYEITKDKLLGALCSGSGNSVEWDLPDLK